MYSVILFWTVLKRDSTVYLFLHIYIDNIYTLRIENGTLFDLPFSGMIDIVRRSPVHTSLINNKVRRK